MKKLVESIRSFLHPCDHKFVKTYVGGGVAEYTCPYCNQVFVTRYF